MKIIFITLFLCLFTQACSIYKIVPPMPPGAKLITPQKYRFKEVIINKNIAEGSEPYNIYFAPNTIITNEYNQKELKFIRDGTWKKYLLCYRDGSNSWLFLPHSTNWLGKNFTVVDSDLSHSNREYRIIRIP